MSIQPHAKPYKTINGDIFLLANAAILKPKKVDEVLIVPNGVLEALSSESYRFLYNDDFIELFRGLDDFETVKEVITNLKGGELEEASRVEIDKSIRYALGRYPNKISEYIRGHFPRDYEVTFTNGCQIVIKNLVYQNTSGSKGFRLFIDVNGKEQFRFPNSSVDSVSVCINR